VPQVAESVSKVSDSVWEVTLKSGYQFSDGTTVTATHVADCLTELNMKNSNAKSTLGKMTVTAPSELTVRIESERITHVMDAVLAEWVFVVYKKDSDGDFVFTGPYYISHYEEGDHMDVKPNKYYYDGKNGKRPRMIEIKKFADGHDLAKGLESKTVDIGFHLPIDTLPNLKKLKHVHIKSFEVGYHYMMFHNIDTLDDVRVRKAIDLAIDRNALSDALSGGRGTRSLFPDYSPYFTDDSNANNGNSSASKALLAEANWTLDSNGMRTKDGQKLHVNLVAYPHRPGLVIMQPLIDKTLIDIGINVTSILTGDDWDETTTIINSRTFDLLMWAQHTLPSGDPSFFLNNFFRSDGDNNHANFASDKVDNLLDTLSIAEESTARITATKAAHNAIVDQVPVSNLVTPSWHVGLSDRMRGYEPWGSDYYVIRADLYDEDHHSSSYQRQGMLISLVFSIITLFRTVL